MRKIILRLIVAFIIILVVANRKLISYGWMQAKGQAKIVLGVKEVNELLADPSFPDSFKVKIRLIEEIKRFGVDSLGLNPSENYTTFYDQQGKLLMWVITASPKYEIKPYEWRFPILGKFPYLGFFDSTRAEAEVHRLRNEGFDTDVGNPGGWSTLGYFRDPIMSGMLRRNEGSLANLILHELTHGTLFVKNDVNLNENLASFVGDLGALRFLSQKYGPNSAQVKKYDFYKRYDAAFSAHMLRGARQLDSLYASFKELPETRKEKLKTQAITHIFASADTLLSSERTLSRKSSIPVKLPSNAYFVSFLTYSSRQDTFAWEFNSRFHGDFKTYLAYLKKKYPSL